MQSSERSSVFRYEVNFLDSAETKGEITCYGSARLEQRSDRLFHLSAHLPLTAITARSDEHQRTACMRVCVCVCVCVCACVCVCGFFTQILSFVPQHGMGIPSIGILLHEVIKLMYHARVRDPVFFRIGTCGGIGLECGTVVISEEAVDGMLQPYLELVTIQHVMKTIQDLQWVAVFYTKHVHWLQPVLGKVVRRPARLDRTLARELQSLSEPDDPYETVTGKTMCTYDFYEGNWLRAALVMTSLLEVL